MDIESLRDDLEGREFSVLAVGGSRPDFASYHGLPSNLTVDWHSDTVSAGKILRAGRPYNLLVVDDDEMITPRSMSHIIGIARGRIGTHVVVAGAKLYDSAHLRAIINGADGYVPAGADWKYNPHPAAPTGKPDQLFVTTMLAAADELRPQVARDLYNELRFALNDDSTDAMPLHEIVYCAVSNLSPRVPDAVRPAIDLGIDDLLVNASQSRSGRVVIDPDYVERQAMYAPIRGHLPTWAKDEATATPGGGLFWTTRFPGNDDVLRYSPHLVFVERPYLLETAINAQPDLAGVVQAVARDDVIGKELAFQFSTENGELHVENDREWSHSTVSVPVTCSSDGTAPFRVTYRAMSAGPAVVKVHLIVDNSAIAEQTIELRVIDPGMPAPQQIEASESPTSPLPSGTASDAPRADYRMHVEGDGASLWRDSTKIFDSSFLGQGNWAGGSPASFLSQIAITARDSYAALHKLSKDYEPDLGGGGLKIQKAPYAKLALAKIGAQLHDYLFFKWPDGADAPPGMPAIAERLRPLGGLESPSQLQIVADQYPIPWGILYDRHSPGELPAEPGDVDINGFWGIRFDMFRSPTTADRSPRRGARRYLKPIIGELVPNAGAQIDFLDKLREDPLVEELHIDAPSRTISDVEKWAKSGQETDLLYLFCHARPTPLNPYIGFAAAEEDPNQRVTIGQLKGWWGESRRTNPVVFLNACSSGQNDLVTGTPFMKFFTRDWAAQAFLGTDWPVHSKVADLIGRRIVEQVIGNRLSIGAALRTVIREGAENDNLYPLMYAIYGPNNVQFIDPP